MDLGPVIQSELSQKENNKFDYQHIYVECRKMAQMNLFAGRNRDADVEKGLVDTVWGGEGETSERVALTYTH